MIEARHPAGLIDQAREALEQVSALVARAYGEDWEAARGHLERAARLMESAVRALGPKSACGDAKPALVRFLRELRKVDTLHRQSGAFYSGWMRILAQFSGVGYSPREGTSLPALVPPGLRVSLEA